MTDPVEGRTRRQIRAELEEETRLVERRVDDHTRLVDRSADDGDSRLVERRTDDDTRLAERDTDEETRLTPRRTPSAGTRTDAAGRQPSIAHGRADTPRVASVPGVVVAGAVYGPRRGETGPPIVRDPVAPPAAPTRTDRMPRVRRAPLIVGVVLGAAAIVAGAVWGIILIVGGGM